MITIGLTGGIGSGKSVVASLLEVYGIPVYVADEESKRLLDAPNPNRVSNPVRVEDQPVPNPIRVETSLLHERLTALLGDAIYGPDGLNRRLMASLIFNDARLLEQVNAIIHPEVALHFQSWAERQSTKYVVLESAILFESNFNHWVDSCVMVYAPRELRIHRVMERDRVTEAEVWLRMQHQIPDEEKMEHADYVIYNDEQQALIPQVEKWKNNYLKI